MTHDSAREVIARALAAEYEGAPPHQTDRLRADGLLSALQSAGYAVVPVADRLTASQQLRNLAKGIAHVDLKTTAEERSHNLVWADDHTYAHRSAADITELLEALGAISGLSAMLTASDSGISPDRELVSSSVLREAMSFLSSGGDVGQDIANRLAGGK